MSCDIILQTEGVEGLQRKGFTGVPAARRSRITILSSGADAGRKHVSELADELQAILLASSPLVAVDDAMSAPTMDELTQPQHERDRIEVLVLVGSAGQKFLDEPWHLRWDDEKKDYRTMVVLPPGRFEDQFDESIPGEHLLRRINAFTWQKSVTEVLPSVLSRAGVTSVESRIFISYRRVETLPIALQLFDHLVQLDFDVFLDRFSIPPGYDFQRRLSQELQDKSMVVLLESKKLKDSKWTQHEIDFTKRHRLGLLTVQMPDVEDEDRLMSVDAREKLERRDFCKDPVESGGVKQWQKLKKDALERVLARIKAVHADALFRRRHRLRGDIVDTLNQLPGVQATYTAVGPIEVVYSGNPPGEADECDEHLVWPTTRPPEVEDFRLAHAKHLTRTNATAYWRTIIVGPHAALEPDRRERLAWLGKVSQCLSFDEGDLRSLARNLVARFKP